MSQFVSQALQSAKDQTEKAAIIAEAAFSFLPEAAALAARRCVILHWFDQLLVETMLEDSELTFDEMRHAYEQLALLPFIDSVPWGLTFQNGTREGLLRRYVSTQPELLQTAARLAAPAYEMQEEDKKSIAEAFYCYLVAGDQEAATALQQALFVQASSNQDWQYVNNLLQLQAEAERLPFVRPLPRNERQLLLQGLVHRVQGKQDAALLDYTQALDINPTSILAYVSRGTTYVEQKSYNRALADYNTASRIDRNFAPTYLSRSVVYTKQGKYREALKENNKAVQLGLNTDMVYINKANILNELGQYEDALTACNTALQINQHAIEAYIGKGQALNGLENYNEALSVYEKALLLNPDAIDAYIGKGKALNGLQRYTEALEACNIAIKLDPNSADAYRVQAYAYRSLMQYELASEANRRANELDPITEEEVAHEDVITNKGKNKNTEIRKRRERSANNNQKTVSFLGNITGVFRPTQDRAQKRAKTFRKSMGNVLAVAIVGIIIFASIVLFSPIRSTIGGNTTPTAAASASITATPASTTSTTPTSVIPSANYAASQPGPGCDTGGGIWTVQGIGSITCGTTVSPAASGSWGYLYLQLPNNAAFSANNKITVSVSNIGSGSGECVGLAEQDANTGFLASYCDNGTWSIASISNKGTIIRTLSSNITATRTTTTISLALVNNTLSFTIDAESHRITVSPIQLIKVAIAYYDSGDLFGIPTNNFSYITSAS